MDSEIIKSKSFAICVGGLFAECVVSSYGFLDGVVQAILRERRLTNLRKRSELGDYDAKVEIVVLTPDMPIQQVFDHLTTAAVWGMSRAKILLARTISRLGTHVRVNTISADNIDRDLNLFRESEDLMRALYCLNIRMIDSSRSKELNQKIGNVWQDTWCSEYDPFGTLLLEDMAKILESIIKKNDGKTFVDPSFEPSYKSLCAAGMTLPASLTEMLISWRRPVDIGNPFAKIQLFAKGVSPRDVCQGLLGDCFLLAVLASLAALHRREVWDIRKLIDDRFSHLGLYVLSLSLSLSHAHTRSSRFAQLIRYTQIRYGIKLFVRGRWITIPVDDYFPTVATMINYKTSAQDQLTRWSACFSSISNYENATSCRKELWCALIEKAFAKLAGSYAAVEEVSVGSLGYTLNTLTGGVAERVDSESSEMWNKMTSSAANCIVASLRIDYEKKFGEKIGIDGSSSEGLVTNHVYSVIDTLEHDGVKLVRVRNPWGHTSWNGAYSKKHSSWNNHSTLLDTARAAEVKMGTTFMTVESNRSFAASVRAETGSPSFLENDGIFWMEYKDFCDRFVCFICDLSEERTATTVRGHWKIGKSAGGRPKKYQAVQKEVSTSSTFRNVFLSMANMFTKIVEPNATFRFLQHIDTFQYNDRFLLRVRAGSKFYLTLSQPDNRRDSSSWKNPGSNYNANASTVASLFLLHPTWCDPKVDQKEKEKYPPIELTRSGYCHTTCKDVSKYLNYKKSSVITSQEKENVKKKRNKNIDELPSLRNIASCAPRPVVGLPDNYPVDEYIVCAAAWRTCSFCLS